VTEHCYKVVQEYGEGELVAYGSVAVAPARKYFTIYEIGVQTFAPIGELFVFPKQYDAITFINGYVSQPRRMLRLRLLYCECGRLRPLRHCASETYFLTIQQWWQWWQRKPGSQRDIYGPLAWDTLAPSHTHITPWVIPLEEVERSWFLGSSLSRR
jgi:hypothetical protein